MRNSSAWLCLLALTTIGAGCAARPWNLTDAAPVAIEKVPSEHADFQHVTIVPTENSMTVSGQIRFSSPLGRRMAGHLDVTVLDSSGRTVVRHAVSYRTRWRPHLSRAGRLLGAHRQESQSARFLLQIEHSPEPGLIIRLDHHHNDQAACLGLSLALEEAS
ncbi:MAG: hypothetical protein IT442_17035 [Phycisphaeraceae bacterium]|nr:hypothetical protein [Phycisphaeraceae bacterium]